MTDKNTDKEKATACQKTLQRTELIERSRELLKEIEIATWGKMKKPNHNKPQHSPLPWFTMAQPKPDDLHAMVSIWAGSETRESIVCNSCSPTDAKLIVASVNNAAKLAEALRVAKDVLAERGIELKEITRALAAYESEVQQ